jgi:hypothetical protein
MAMAVLLTLGKFSPATIWITQFHEIHVAIHSRFTAFEV